MDFLCQSFDDSLSLNSIMTASNDCVIKKFSLHRIFFLFFFVLILIQINVREIYREEKRKRKKKEGRRFHQEFSFEWSTLMTLLASMNPGIKTKLHFDDDGKLCSFSSLFFLFPSFSSSSLSLPSKYYNLWCILTTNDGFNEVFTLVNSSERYVDCLQLLHQNFQDILIQKYQSTE